MDQSLLALLGGGMDMTGGGDPTGMILTPDSIKAALAKDEQDRRAEWLMNFGAALANGRGGLLPAFGQASMQANQLASKDEGQSVKKLLTTAQLQGTVAAQGDKIRSRQDLRAALQADPNLSDEQRQALLSNPALGTEYLKTALMPKVPTTRKITRGDLTVDQEYDPTSKSWKDVGQGPAHQPQSQFQAMPDGRTLNTITGQITGKANAFAGNGISAQAYNILLTGDPNSPEYALAYSEATKPQLVMTENGMVPIMPQLPPNIRRPAGMEAPGAAPQQPGAAPAAQPNATAAPQQAQPVSPPVTQVPGSPYAVGAALPNTKSPKEFTNDQRLASGFANRMESADSILSGLENVAQSGVQHVLGSVPAVGNYLASDDYQKVEQAQRDFANAILRKESGAAIGASEFTNAKQQYFPQPGDSKPVIEQKRQARKLAIENMKNAAGSAYAPTKIDMRQGDGGGNKNPYSSMSDDQILGLLKQQGLVK